MDSSEATAIPAPRETDARPSRGAGIAIAATGLLLRALEAGESSLWLDELHTLHHASRPDASAVIASVSSEYHTPLFFLAVHLFGGFEAGAWLRAIPVLSSVLLLLPLDAIGRLIGLTSRARLCAAWLYACLPYQVLYGSELRPYAWLGIAGALAFLAAFSERGPMLARAGAFFASILAGLATHRAIALALPSIGGARLVTRRGRALSLLALIVAGSLAVAGFLPWMLGFAKDATENRFEYQESVGGYRLRPALIQELLSLPSRLATPYMRELGGAWGMLELSATAIFAVACAVLLVAAWRARGARPPVPALRGLWVFAVTQFVLTTAFAVWTWDRAPLQYYAPMAWAIPLLLAAAWQRANSDALRRGLGWVLCVSVLAMAIGLVGGRSREDMRAGVAALRDFAREARESGAAEPIYTSILTQPRQFPHTIPFDAYGRDLAPVAPDTVPRPGDADFARPLLVLRRVLPLTHADWKPITDGRRVVRERRIDRYLTAYWFAPAL